MRGAIVQGEFLIKQHCVAGSAIIKAYKLCDSLDFAGIVYEEALNKWLASCFHKSMFNSICVNYLTPQKNATEQKLIHINWLYALEKKELQTVKLDVEKFVLRSFWKHNKDCPKVVDEKVANTVKLLRRFIITLEDDK